MNENRIDAALDAQAQQSALDAIQAARNLLPFLLDLSPEERHALPKLGPKSLAFVQTALDVAAQNPDILPRNFDMEEFRRDVELFTALQPVAVSLRQLHELVEDTLLAVGSEAYVGALTVYQYARNSGQGAALDAALDELGRRFARKSRAAAPVPPAPAP